MQSGTFKHPAARYADPSAGQSYFSWQQSAGRKGAVYNLKFFAPYISESDSVLEFGSGGGYLLAALHCREKVGVEINPVARGEAAKNGIETYSAPMELCGRAFDRVISSHCLEHVANPYESLCQVRDLLRKDGRLVLLLPLDDWRSQPWVGPDNDAHLYTWTPRLLGNLLVAAGFDPIMIKTIHRCWPPRFDEEIWAFSRAVFEALGYLSAVVLRRRQLWTIARPS